MRRRLLPWILGASALGFAVGAFALHAGPTAIDLDVGRWLQGLDADGFWAAVSAPGDGIARPAAIVLVFAAVALVARGKRIAAWYLGFCGAAFVLEQAFKRLVGRPRPLLPIRILPPEPTGFSYPSGHVVWWIAAFGGLAVLGVLPKRKGVRVAVVALATVYGVLLAASRVALGHHHASDVLGSACMTLPCLGLLMLIAKREDRPAA